jgi:hypothetical protein
MKDMIIAIPPRREIWALCICLFEFLESVKLIFLPRKINPASNATASKNEVIKGAKKMFTLLSLIYNLRAIFLCILIDQTGQHPIHIACYFFIFSVTQNSPKYFLINIRVWESMAGSAPRTGAMKGARNHCENIYMYLFLGYLAGLGGSKKKLKNIDVIKPTSAIVMRYLVTSGRLCAITL